MFNQNASLIMAANHEGLQVRFEWTRSWPEGLDHRIIRAQLTTSRQSFGDAVFTDIHQVPNLIPP